MADKGKLIVLEGIDGSGKSAQYRRLKARFEREGIDCRTIVFPRYDQESSALIRMYLEGRFGKDPEDVGACAASIFYAVDRYDAFMTDWGEYYRSGGVVLSDRYTTSNAVHQGAKLSEAEQPAFFDWLYDLEYVKLGLPRPDLVIYLDVDLETSLARMRHRQEKTGKDGDIHEKDVAYLAACLATGRSLIWALLLGQNEYPYKLYPSISWEAWAMVALTVVMSVLICLYTYQKSARETTADLLRPKPPKAGRRILLERVGFLWRRFNFNTKMIVRNLMRNRMRTIMSFVGILCCNALIIASLGLQDSVNALAENHYTKALCYDVRADLTGETDEAESYRRRLDAEGVECIMEKSLSARSATESRTTLLTVVEPGQTMLRVGKNETLVDILPGGTAITEKLAQTLEVSVGDTLELFFPGDDDPVRVKITQIVYNSVSQGLYMESGTWESLRKGAFMPTAILLKGPTQACLSELDAMEEVDQLNWPVDQAQELTQMLDMLASIFAMITLIALALAFVICYNMGLMNFSERTREYATLKVLGYHQKEIRGLIIGENNIVSLLGVLCVILPGIGLTGLVLRVCESEMMAYPSRPAALSVVLASVVTYVFSLLIQLLLTRKVRGIDMVEALKSVE